jgi:polyribonucleotide nucleotidyltransferase
MTTALAAPRPQSISLCTKNPISKTPEDKIGEVIVLGGKTIKAMMEKYDVEIDIDDNGYASISSQDAQKIADCAYEIESMIKEVQIGEQI